MRSDISIEPNIYVRRLVQVALTAVAIGAFPILARIVGIQFLPSKEWVARTWMASVIVGLVVTAVFTLAFLRMRKRTDPDQRSASQLLVILLGPFLAGAIAMDGFRVGIPFMYTIFMGQPSELRYTVKQASGWSERKCRNKIELHEMPSMYNAVCGFAEDFRNTLRPGVDVVLIGRGTSLGVFVDRARAAK